MEELVRRYLCLVVRGTGSTPGVQTEVILIEHCSDGVIGGQMDRGGIGFHVERRETRYPTVENRVLGIFQFGLLVVVGISSASRAHIMNAVLVEVLKRVVIAG